MKRKLVRYLDQVADVEVNSETFHADRGGDLWAVVVVGEIAYTRPYGEDVEFQEMLNDGLLD